MQLYCIYCRPQRNPNKISVIVQRVCGVLIYCPLKQPDKIRLSINSALEFIQRFTFKCGRLNYPL